MRKLLPLLLLLAPACGAASPKNADLVADVRGYSDGMRWRDFNAAALRLKPAERTDFMDRRAELDEDLRIADWELKRLTYSDDRNRAEVHIEWTWLLDSRGIVHTTVTRQAWSRHGKNWILDREIRLRGEPMPGLAEPKRPPARKVSAKERTRIMPDDPVGPRKSAPARNARR